VEIKRKKLLDELKRMFENDSNRNIFKKYIEYIRFPFFKNFEKDLKVNFTFPVTFIVGQNGSGKSSLLHALYGAPEGKSVEEFWYTTDLDPINDLKDNRHCFIYSYKTNGRAKVRHFTAFEVCGVQCF
jgi:predicted ATPase